MRRRFADVADWGGRTPGHDRPVPRGRASRKPYLRLVAGSPLTDRPCPSGRSRGGSRLPSVGDVRPAGCPSALPSLPLGPFRLTISMGALAGGLGLLDAGLFKIDVADCLPFVASHLILQGVISGLITGGRTAFIDAGGVIKQVNLPLSAHVWRNFILFAQWPDAHLKGGSSTLGATLL